MSPKVTLLGDPWMKRTVIFGKRQFVFYGGEPREVPVAVALVLKRRKDDSGKLLFKVENLPMVVKAMHPAIEPIPIVPPPVQNETRSPKQRKLAEWHS